jgi:hypothetical protein
MRETGKGEKKTLSAELNLVPKNGQTTAGAD